MSKPDVREKHALWARITAVAVLGCALAGCGAGVKTQGGNQVSAAAVEMGKPIQGERATLLVYGMGCPLCANNIDKELLTVPGVSKAEVDMGAGKVRLELSGATRPTPRQLAQAVEHAGFTYKGITVP